MTSCDLNALCRRSEMPLMYGTEAVFKINISKSECKGKGEDFFRIKWPERPI